MSEERGPSQDAAQQERDMREHEREARERESAERSPIERADDLRSGNPAPPGNVQQSG